MIEGILGLIGTVLGLVLWWLKSRSKKKNATPEQKAERLLNELEEALASMDSDRIAAIRAELRRLRMLKTGGDNRGSSD